MSHHSSVALVLCLATLGLACGNEDGGGAEDNGGSSSAGVGGSGGSLSLGVGGTGGGGGAGGSGALAATGARDGGVRDLTDDEVNAIDGEACQGWTSEPETLPAVLELVVDTSLSMNETPDGRGNGGPGGGGGDTKWEITRDALKDVLSSLPESLAIGLFFYPNMPNEGSDEPRPLEACVNTEEGIAVAQLSADHRQRLIDALDDTSPDGWTPTHGAYIHALEESLLPAAFPGDKYMLLITDGAPTLTLECTSEGNGQGGPRPVDPEPIVDEVSAARAAGVRTFLIGSPGSEDGRPWMSQAAIVGATAAAGCRVSGDPYCHMDMTAAPDFGAALRAGLTRVTGAIACTYDIPPPPSTDEMIDRARINLIVTSASGGAQLVLPDESGDCTEGWRFSGEQIVLCEQTCARVQQDGGSLQLLFGCESGTIEVPK